MSKEAMNLALEALQDAILDYSMGKGAVMRHTKAIKALEEALAKQEHGEPVAIVDANDDGYWADILPDRTVKVGQLLYTKPLPKQEQGESVAQCCSAGIAHDCHAGDGCRIVERIKTVNTTPQQRKPLTDEQLIDLWPSLIMHQHTYAFARAIEAAHGIK